MWILILESRSKDVAIRVFDSRRSASTYVETLQASNWIILEIRKRGLMRVSTATPPPTTAQKLPETRIPPDALPYPLAARIGLCIHEHAPCPNTQPEIFTPTSHGARVPTNALPNQPLGTCMLNYTMARTESAYELSYASRTPSLRHQNHVSGFRHNRY